MADLDGNAKLIDFGLSQQRSSSDEKLNALAGTPAYIAPEVIVGNYGNECDVWSLGVTMYHCMSGGKFPFGAENENKEKIFEKIRAGNYNSDVFPGVSGECVDLIKKMLDVDVRRRITPKKIL
jgi:serine/threonine protein kinase